MSSVLSPSKEEFVEAERDFIRRFRQRQIDTINHEVAEGVHYEKQEPKISHIPDAMKLTFLVELGSVVIDILKENEAVDLSNK